MQQFDFGFIGKKTREFGGSLLVGNRKSSRPLSTKEPILLTMKTEGVSLFNPTVWSLDKIIQDYAHRYNVKLYETSLNWNHIHLLIQIPCHKRYKAFIRTLTANLVAYLSEKLGKDMSGMFTFRPHTKIIHWGKHFCAARDYVIKNQMEAWGLAKRKEKQRSRRASSG